jgi:hypothetical protein
MIQIRRPIMSTRALYIIAEGGRITFMKTTPEIARLWTTLAYCRLTQRSPN